ncbi:hypothetical protein BOTBODRAFT_67452 [Botryobasidium botryosum FD-172 SS1]|uniref:BTB domain-containing protein n=1 Tax=Botryobasidium botryosum (strain FD-172 SS1) TaxID=930990 RepID=A0A067M8Z2_BOTB1|nr:hypothetical protein BOTBODRAFT_67452 [Botryobasidium botryosum FD-172 SS1]
MNDDKQAAVRDPKYYFADGSVIIRVEDRLFKIHKSRLSTNSSIFETLFTLPESTASGSGGREGQSDENPVILEGESSIAFRSLVWALYATPPEIARIQHSSDMGHIETVADVARLAHKYDLNEYESWGTECLSHFLPFLPASDLRVYSILRAAILCHDEVLQQSALQRIRNGIRDHLYDPIDAIKVADDLGFRPLIGLAYYYTLSNARERVDSWMSHPELTRDQRIRLMSGHCQLVALGQRQRRILPSHPHFCQLQSRARCEATWKSYMNAAFFDVMSPDVLVVLRAEILLEAAAKLEPRCQTAFKSAVHNLAIFISEADLWKVFADVQ